MPGQGLHEGRKGRAAIKDRPVLFELPEVLPQEDAAESVLVYVPGMEQDAGPARDVHNLKGFAKARGIVPFDEVLLSGQPSRTRVLIREVQ